MPEQCSTGIQQPNNLPDGLKQTELGPLSEDWEVVRLGEMAETKAGGTPSTFKKEYWEKGDIPWINSGALKDNFVGKATKYITELGLENSVAKLLPRETVLIALTGATTGRVGFLEFECATNQSVVGILPNNNFISMYLFYYLMFSRERVLGFKSGAVQPHINKAIVDNLLVSLPSLLEQKKPLKSFQPSSVLLRPRVRLSQLQENLKTPSCATFSPTALCL